jgi:cation:H+ antiporter
VGWLGRRLKMGTLAVGTILAAIGTALPESVVTFVAVVFGNGSAGKDIGVGAALGGPLVLATVAYGVTGAVLLYRRRARLPALAGGWLSSLPTRPTSGRRSGPTAAMATSTWSP